MNSNEEACAYNNDINEEYNDCTHNSIVSNDKCNSKNDSNFKINHESYNNNEYVRNDNVSNEDD